MFHPVSNLLYCFVNSDWCAAQCNNSSRVWQDPGWHTLKVKAYRASGASTINRKHRLNRIIHGFFLMSWKRPSFTADFSPLKQQRTKYKACHASKFHCATSCISAVLRSDCSRPLPTRRDSRNWNIARQFYARLAITAWACQLEPWPLGAALWAAVTRASLLYLTQADLLRAGAEKQTGPESRTPHLEGPPAELFRWSQS